MLVWLPQKIYNKIKNNEEYKKLHNELDTLMNDGSFTSIIWENNKNSYEVHLKIKNLIKKSLENEVEKLFFDLNFLDSESYEKNVIQDNLNLFSIDQEYIDQSFKNKLIDIESRINLLEDNLDKHILKIYFLENKKASLLMENSYYCNELIEIRNEILNTFDNIKHNFLDEETILIYFYNYCDMYVYNNVEHLFDVSKENFSKIYSKFILDIEYKIEELKNLKLEKNNLRLNDYLEHTKLICINQFYEKMMNKTSLDEDRILFDSEIFKFYNKNTFKYKKFNLTQLHFYWIRMKNFFDHDNKDKFLLLFDELCSIISVNLKNKNFVVSSLNYFNYSKHIDFLIFLKGILELQDFLFENLKKEKKLLDLNFTVDELKILESQIINFNSPFRIDIEHIKNKLNG